MLSMVDSGAKNGYYMNLESAERLLALGAC
jgi:hypothetical protein